MPQQLDTNLDIELVAQALAEFRQQHGFNESIQFGDLDTPSQSIVIRRAQALKKEAGR